VLWKPFFLDPNTPAEGEDLEEHLDAKYGKGSYKKFNQPTSPLILAGKKLGIDFLAGEGRRFVPTMQAHRLVESLKADEKAQNTLVEKLFEAYFERAVDISQPEELQKIGEAAGMDTALVAAIAGDKLGDRVEPTVDDVKRADHRSKTGYNVNGVPFFVILAERLNAAGEVESRSDRPVGFSGAQPADVINMAMEQVVQDVMEAD